MAYPRRKSERRAKAIRQEGDHSDRRNRRHFLLGEIKRAKKIGGAAFAEAQAAYDKFILGLKPAVAQNPAGVCTKCNQKAIFGGRCAEHQKGP
jgi:hypothetical protein